MRQLSTLFITVLALVASPSLAAPPDDDFFFFSGSLDRFQETLTNPYSGRQIQIDRDLYINQGVYFGGDGTDFLLMEITSEFIQLKRGGVQYIDSVELILGSDGDDIIFLADNTTSYADATITGGDGDDLIWSNVGDDTIFGDPGNDVVDGGPGSDIIDGDSGNDVVDGGPGSDIIYGDDGNDMLSGGDGDDVFSGYFSGSGDDIIVELPDGDVDTIELIPNTQVTWLRIGRDLQLRFVTTGQVGAATVLVRNQFDGLGTGIDQLRFVSNGSIVILPRCPADYDSSTTVETLDLFIYLDAWFGQVLADGVPGVPNADFDDNGTVDPADLFGYLDAWFMEVGICGL